MSLVTLDSGAQEALAKSNDSINNGRTSANTLVGRGIENSFGVGKYMDTAHNQGKQLNFKTKIKTNLPWL